MGPTISIPRLGNCCFWLSAVSRRLELAGTLNQDAGDGLGVRRRTVVVDEAVQRGVAMLVAVEERLGRGLGHGTGGGVL